VDKSRSWTWIYRHDAQEPPFPEQWSWIAIDGCTGPGGIGWQQAADTSSEEVDTCSASAGKPWIVIYTGHDSELVVDHLDTAGAAGGRAPQLHPEEGLADPFEEALDPVAQDEGAA
jgi:hypothetical protein